MRGPHVKAGQLLERGNPKDLMSTMLWLLGLPRSDQLVGKELTEAFEPGFVREQVSRRVASYGPRVRGESMASQADEAMLESLRALGYVE